MRIDYESECKLIFRFLQVKIHFNLKSDYENEIFYEKCENVLVKKEKRFHNSKNICLKTNSILFRMRLKHKVKKKPVRYIWFFQMAFI